MPFFSTRRRVRNENLTSLRGGARMLKSCQLLRLEKTLQNSRISHVKTGQKQDGGHGIHTFLQAWSKD